MRKLIGTAKPICALSVARRCIAVVIALLSAMPAQAQEHHSDTFDDVLQYVPYASVFALKACGVQSRDEWPQLAVTAAASWVATAGVAYVLKHSVKEWRPDGSDQLSFPSGHSCFAFAGATVLHKEFGRLSPWISVAGYGIATMTAIDRVVNDRHHWYDVAAGAGIGILSTEVTYYLGDKLFKNSRLFNNDHASLVFTGTQLSLALRW